MHRMSQVHLPNTPSQASAAEIYLPWVDVLSLESYGEGLLGRGLGQPGGQELGN